MSASLMVLRILFHAFLVNIAPLAARHSLEGMVFDLFRLAERKKIYKPRRKARVGKAFLGRAVCHSIECRYEFGIFTSEGCHPDVELSCPKCNQETVELL